MHLVFPDDCTSPRILQEDMKIQGSILYKAFYIAERRTTLSSASVVFALDCDHFQVHTRLSSESPFMRRSVLTEAPLLLSRLQTQSFIQFLKDDVHSCEAQGDWYLDSFECHVGPVHKPVTKTRTQIPYSTPQLQKIKKKKDKAKRHGKDRFYKMPRRTNCSLRYLAWEIP